MPIPPIEPIDPADIAAARERLHGIAIRTPLLRLETDAKPEVYLKLENLQPMGSFKIRGAANALARIPRERLREGGVYTASAGNMAQGVAWSARRAGVHCRVIVPERAPRTKLDAITRLGAEYELVPFEEWWRVMEEHERPGEAGVFVHPVSHPDVIAGHGTIGLEIAEDLPEVEAVVVPYGGGGLVSGVATAVRSSKPDVRVHAAEVATAAPLAASLEAGRPVAVDRVATFVDGIGGKAVLREMWPLVRSLVDSSLVVGIADVVEAIRLLAVRSRVVAEGAGAAPVAAAVAGMAGEGPVVCVVSGGNIDRTVLSVILGGGTP